MSRKPADGNDQRMREIIGAFFLQQREGKGWSKRAAAHRIGMHRTTLGLIERGMCFPTWPHACQLAHAYGVTLIDIATLIEREFGYIAVDEDEAAA